MYDQTLNSKVKVVSYFENEGWYSYFENEGWYID